MDSIRIRGGRRLNGSVAADGAKNAALPALAASLLTDGELALDNVPLVRDVRTMLRVLQHLGGEGFVEPGVGFADGADGVGAAERKSTRCIARSRDESGRHGN